MDPNNTTIALFPGTGNGLTPSHDISPGDILIKISNPYLLVVERDALNTVCSFCLLESQPDTSLKKCGGCKIPQYCGKVCQKADWKAGHVKECPLLKGLPDVPPTPVRGLMQLLLRHETGMELDERWKGLESHKKELEKDVERWGEMVLQGRGAVEFSKFGGGEEGVKLALEMLCRVCTTFCLIRSLLKNKQMSTNAFRATLADDSPVGLCFEPTMALANHSCDPNAAIIFDGRLMSLRAMKSIKKGEQIFITYIDPTEIREERRHKLQHRYFFHCQCPKCEGDLTPYQLLLKSPPSTEGKINLLCDTKELLSAAEKTVAFIKDNQKLLSDMHKETSFTKDGLEASKTMDLPDRGTALRVASSSFAPLAEHGLYAISPYPNILHSLYLYFVDSEAFLQSLIVLLFLYLHCDVYTYPQPHHPVRVIRLFTIAKVMKYIATLEPAQLLDVLEGQNETTMSIVSTIDWVDSFHAVMILVNELGKESHGKESRFMKEVEGELNDVEEIQRARGEVGGRLALWAKEDDIAGRREARRIFGGLRRLAECVGDIIGLKKNK